MLSLHEESCYSELKKWRARKPIPIYVSWLQILIFKGVGSLHCLDISSGRKHGCIDVHAFASEGEAFHVCANHAEVCSKAFVDSHPLTQGEAVD